VHDIVLPMKRFCRRRAALQGRGCNLPASEWQSQRYVAPVGPHQPEARNRESGDVNLRPHSAIEHQSQEGQKGHHTSSWSFNGTQPLERSRRVMGSALRWC